MSGIIKTNYNLIITAIVISIIILGYLWITSQCNIIVRNNFLESEVV